MSFFWSTVMSRKEKRYVVCFSMALNNCLGDTFLKLRLTFCVCADTGMGRANATAADDRMISFRNEFFFIF